MRQVREIFVVTVAALMFTFYQPASAQEQNFAVNSTLSVLNFDLNSIRQVQPGRFVVSVLTLDKPDIMRMRMAATRELYKFCLRPAGLYQSVASMYGVGPPDLPVKKVEVSVSIDGVGAQRKPYKAVIWKYPYKLAASCDDDKCVDIREETELVTCRDTQVENDNEFKAWWKIETNGVTTLESYDCDHGLTGTSFPKWGADNIVMYPIRPNSLGEEISAQICQKVLGREPYMVK